MRMIEERHCPIRNCLESSPLWRTSKNLNRSSFTASDLKAISTDMPLSGGREPLPAELKLESVWAMLYLPKWMPVWLEIHVTLLDRLKSFGLNPKKRMPNNIAAARHATNLLKVLFFNDPIGHIYPYAKVTAKSGFCISWLYLNQLPSEIHRKLFWLHWVRLIFIQFPPSGLPVQLLFCFWLSLCCGHGKRWGHDNRILQ